MEAKTWIGELFPSFFLILLALNYFTTEATKLPQVEVVALKQIAAKLGKKDWDFNVDPCSGDSGWVTVDAKKGFENNVSCDCSFNASTLCHVTNIVLKSQNLSGILPPELPNLPFLQELDLSRNFLNGTIPVEWSVMNLTQLSLLGNRLSGHIPNALGRITTLKNLTLESNQFSGSLPAELGNLRSLKRLLLSSNNLTGELPETLGNLINLTDFRISDNSFSGKIPDFIQKWTMLDKLHIQGTSLEGPIPSVISALEKLTDLRISDIDGKSSEFPDLSKMGSLKTLVLRNCLITGEIPDYFGGMTKLKSIDLSFNKLTGQIPSSFEDLSNLGIDYMYLTRNMLTGPIPKWITRKNNNVDISFNNFTWSNSLPSGCQQGNTNMFASYSTTGDNSSGITSCLKDSQYTGSQSQHISSLYINCGGDEFITVGNTIYEADVYEEGASSFFSRGNWGFSSTGFFMDDNVNMDSYIATNISVLSMPDPSLYTTARLSPISLTYYGFNLENGNYIVKLHFAEIMFTDDQTYSSLGRRIFDVYIQGKLVLKDFNIEEEAGGPEKAVVKEFIAVVTSNTLEIHFYWAGKGTQSIPTRGVYGPLISAISVDPDFNSQSGGSGGGHKVSTKTVTAIVVVLGVAVILLIVGVCWKKGCMRRKATDYKGANDLTSLHAGNNSHISY